MLFEGPRESQDHSIQNLRIEGKNRCYLEIESYAFTFARNGETLEIASMQNFGGHATNLNDIPPTILRRAENEASVAFQNYDTEQKELRADLARVELLHSEGEEAVERAEKNQDWQRK